MNSPSQAEILRGLHEIPFPEVLLISGTCVLAVWAFRWVISLAVKHVPVRYRFYLLPWPPIFRLLVILVGFTLVLPLVLRPEAGALTALLGTMTLMIGFVLKDYASSLVAGVVVLFERPFTIGDWIRIGEVQGEVLSMDIRTLTIRTPDDDQVSLPYSLIWTGIVFNSTSGSSSQQVSTHLFVTRDHPTSKVMNKLRDVALTSPFVSLARPILVRLSEERGASRYTIKAYPRDARNQFAFSTDVTVRARRALQKMGVSLSRLPDFRD